MMQPPCDSDTNLDSLVNSTTQVFFSKGNEPLKAVSKAEPNDVSGGGQFHFGCLKKGVGKVKDVVREGIQEPNINEGVIYGGIFMEDSANGCISLSAAAGAKAGAVGGAVAGAGAGGAVAKAGAKVAGAAVKKVSQPPRLPKLPTRRALSSLDVLEMRLSSLAPRPR